MRAHVVVVVALAACGARAQGTVVPDALTFNAGDCDPDADDIQVSWQVDDVGPGYFFTIELHERPSGTLQCPRFADQEPLDIVVPFDTELFGTSNGRFYLELEGKPGDFVAPFCSTPTRQDAILCLYATDATNAPQTYQEIDFTLVPLLASVDSDVPERPSITDATGRDNAIVVSVSSVDTSEGDDYTYVVEYRACHSAPGVVADGGTSETDVADAGTDDASLCGAQGAFTKETSESAPVTINGLQNGAGYELRVTVVDDFGNESPASPLVTASPAASHSPMSLYDGAQNPFSVDGPTCAASGTTPVALTSLAFVFALVRARRRRMP